jgi:formamidopyrimidine-DNA glycosylase
MPELPEVQTTVDGLNKTVKGRVIKDVSTTYNSKYYANKDEIKNPLFFKKFKNQVLNQKILKAERRAKNILIHLSNGLTILVHMKMTGYFHYDPQKEEFVRLKFMLDNGKTLAFSDMRKFAKVTVLHTPSIHESIHLRDLGPEPLEVNFTFLQFKKCLMTKGKGKIKQVLMDPCVIAGIGNIYSDEILWRAGVHPLSIVEKIPEKKLKLAFTAMKEVLKKGIDFGGDSMSDYKNINGEKGQFQDHHQAYKRNKQKCLKKGCKGILERVVIGARSAHFCPVHQTLCK